MGCFFQLKSFFMKYYLAIITLITLSGFLSSCQQSESHTLEVVATAYNSLPEQTHNDHPTLTAWGDNLEPGMKAIAVSRDLIGMGLTHEKKVKIEGLDGYYVVRDKMNKRWKKKIDIYMGEDREKALEWGKQKVTIHWKNKVDE